jgi:uncharacterized protein YbjT (DUF2867 family)
MERELKIVAITGATGKIGSVVARKLLKNGLKVKAVGRNKDKLKILEDDGAEIYAGDITDSDFLTDIFKRSDSVFGMIPENQFTSDFYQDKLLKARSIADAVIKSEVKKMVVISAMGVSPPKGIGPSAANGAFEEMLKSIPELEVLVLRCAFLMENYFSIIPMLKYMGIHASPAKPDAAIPMISTRDIAEIAGEYLINDNYDGYKIVELAGPREYNHQEVTSIIGSAINKPDLKYVEISYEDFRKGIIEAGISENLAQDLVEMYKAINDGRVSKNFIRTKSNTTPMTFETFAREIFAPVYNQM